MQAAIAARRRTIAKSFFMVSISSTLVFVQYWTRSGPNVRTLVTPFSRTNACRSQLNAVRQIADVAPSSSRRPVLIYQSKRSSMQWHWFPPCVFFAWLGGADDWFGDWLFGEGWSKRFVIGSVSSRCGRRETGGGGIMQPRTNFFKALSKY